MTWPAWLRRGEAIDPDRFVGLESVPDEDSLLSTFLGTHMAALANGQGGTVCLGVRVSSTGFVEAVGIEASEVARARNFLRAGCDGTIRPRVQSIEEEPFALDDDSKRVALAVHVEPEPGKLVGVLLNDGGIASWAYPILRNGRLGWLEPHELVRRPLSFREKEFDASLDEGPDGDLHIAGQRISRSDALATDPVAYDLALQAFRQQEIDDQNERVMNAFPQPIALRFFNFLRRSRSEHERLHHLQDVWEAIITLCVSLCVCEMSQGCIDGSRVRVDEGGRLSKPNLTFHNIRNGTGILQALAATNVSCRLIRELKDANAFGEAVDALREERNGFTHVETLNRRDVEAKLVDCERVVRKLLEELTFLEEVTLFSPLDLKGGGRAVIYRGKNAEHDKLPDVDMNIFRRRADCQLDVFAAWGKDAFCLSPMIRPYEVAEGHDALLSFLVKQRTDENAAYEYLVYGSTAKPRATERWLDADWQALNACFSHAQASPGPAPSQRKPVRTRANKR